MYINKNLNSSLIILKQDDTIPEGFNSIIRALTKLRSIEFVAYTAITQSGFSQRQTLQIRCNFPSLVLAHLYYMAACDEKGIHNLHRTNRSTTSCKVENSTTTINYSARNEPLFQKKQYTRSVFLHV